MRHGERVEQAVPWSLRPHRPFDQGGRVDNCAIAWEPTRLADRPHLTESMRDAGSGAGARVLVLPGRVLGDLLRAAAAEQPRAGEPLHYLPHVLDGVHQVVD